MKPITANMEHLFQYDKIWFYHFIVILGILMMLGPIYKAASLIFIFIYGVKIGSMVGDILKKPFTFCLFDQIKTSQKFIFLVWLSITLIYSLLMAILFFTGVKSDYALFVGSIGLISLSYWLGIAVILPMGGFITTAFILTIIFSFDLIQNPIAHPLAITLMIGILSYLIYRAIGRGDIVRRLRIMPLADNRFMQDPMSMNQDHRPYQITELIGTFLGNHVRSNRNSMLVAHLWSQVYLIIGLLAAQWKKALLSNLVFWMIFCLMFFAYLIDPRPDDWLMFLLYIFIVASVICSKIFEYLRLNFFLLIGRREYLWRGLIDLFAVVLIVFGLMAAPLLFYNSLSGSLLPIIFEGKSFMPPISWILLVIPIIMLPLFGGLFILFRKTMSLIFITIMLVIAVVISHYGFIAMENTPFIINLLIALSAAAITWGFHIAVLYRESIKRALC